MVGLATGLATASRRATAGDREVGSKAGETGRVAEEYLGSRRLRSGRRRGRGRTANAGAPEAGLGRWNREGRPRPKTESQPWCVR